MAAPHEPRAPSVKILAALRSQLQVSARSPQIKHSGELFCEAAMDLELERYGGPGKLLHSPNNQFLPLINLDAVLLSTPTIRRRAPDHAINPDREFALLVQIAQEADVGG